DAVARGGASQMCVPRQSLGTSNVPWRFLGLGLALRRVVLASGLGMVLFLVTPRVVPMVGDESAVQAARLQTGVGPLMDLNRTGRIRLSGEVVFEVEAQDAGGNPKVDLD